MIGIAGLSRCLWQRMSWLITAYFPTDRRRINKPACVHLGTVGLDKPADFLLGFEHVDHPANLIQRGLIVRILHFASTFHVSLHVSGVKTHPLNSFEN